MSDNNPDLMSKCCWVCFATEEEDPYAQWVQPCNCRGTSKWVHQRCLQRWIDEREKHDERGKVACPQCQTEYIIVYPDMGMFVALLDSVDGVIMKSSLALAAGAGIGALYWSAVTYGAFTVMQVIGREEGLIILEQSDPLVLLLGLPSIPVALILSKLISWEDAVLNFMRRYVPKVPIIKLFLPFYVNDESGNSDYPAVSKPVSATQVLVGALIIPSIANVFGRFFFPNVDSKFHRTIFGGLLFIAVKGCLRIYHKQKQFIRICQRRILDYTESNISTYLQHNQRD